MRKPTPERTADARTAAAVGPPAAANAVDDTVAAEAMLARLIDDNDPAARAAVADALHLRDARDGAPDNPPPHDSTPDTP